MFWGATGPAGRTRPLARRLLRRNLPFAHRLARGYRDRGENLDDLLQDAALALIKAVDGYDPDRGTSFTAYARPTILGELKRHFRARAWGVHIPRQLQERCLEVTLARADLTQRLQRTPSVPDIAAALGLTEDGVRATDASRWRRWTGPWSRCFSRRRAERAVRRKVPAGVDPDGGRRREHGGGTAPPGPCRPPAARRG
ncbi:sigma-70 family RNA polymerase sigma factor [Plantactinospora sp. KLBMP9567]|uniref:sigma-70 family RNA polymerase sigma factor n=1 Tax=Plantactinospora sp. KLBMP9567 TaxID=3085900 RepID=UPI003990828E